MSAEAVARKFWITADAYPRFPHVRERRWAERAYLTKNTDVLVAGSILDVGCGDGEMLSWLAVVNPAAWLYGCDTAIGMVRGAMHAEIEERDAFSDRPFRSTEWTLASGVLPYAFNDRDLRQFFRNVQSQNVYIRTPCTTGPNTVIVNGYSAALGSEYAAAYHPVAAILDAMQVRYEVKRVDRLLPDSLESEFGTKQFSFVGLART